jgi:hypothetical protein
MNKGNVKIIYIQDAEINQKPAKKGLFNALWLILGAN